LVGDFFYLFIRSDLTPNPKVALKRDVVEDMLIQRFRNRIHGVSDEELAQITERLFAEQSTFPADMLLNSPGQQVTAAPPTRKITIEASKLSEPDEIEEDADDDTAELFATLGDVGDQGVIGAAASTVADAIPIDWAPQIPRIAKAVTVGAVLAATVSAASALQRWYRATMKSGGGGETMAPPASTHGVEKEERSSTRGSNGFLSWIFGDTLPEEKPDMISQPASNDVSRSNDIVNTAVDVASMQKEESDASSSPSSNGGQVLWRRKDDTSFQQPPVLNGRSSSSTSKMHGEERTVLWRKSEKVDKEDKVSNGNGNQVSVGLDQQQQDLWRVPLESLKSSGNKEDAEGTSTISPKPVAPSPRPVPITEKSKMVNGFSGGVGPSKLSESALDNAEPPDFIANGVRKL
jgi:hypothetical protein